MTRRIITMTTITALFLSLFLTLGTWQASAASTASDSGLPSRSGQEIADMWKVLMNPTADVNNPYLSKPVTTSPYKAGSLKTDYIKDGLNAVNFYRYITGLPYDVKTTSTLNLQAQYGSVLLAAEGDFSHYPDQPADMSQDFFDKGTASTSTANIYGSSGYNDHLLVRSIDAYMEDSDTSNLAVLGHRRWILNPPLQQVGLGLAASTQDWTYSALQVFDQSRAQKISYNYIAYPAPGAFPIEVFKPNYAWSVSINPDTYAKLSLKDISVSIIRLRDNKTWSLSSKNNAVTESGAYFNVENSHYGTGPAVIFRPAGIDEYRANDVFEVQISGLKSKSGVAQTISYTVNFISAKKYVKSAVEVDPNAPFSDIANHWAKDTIQWAVDHKIISGYPDGTFRPKKTVSEQELLTMFISAFGDNVRAQRANEAWSERFYDYAIDKEYNLRGDYNKNLRALPINRLAVAELIVSGADQPYTGDEAIQYLLENGYSQGQTSATIEGYAGNAQLTRAEAVQFIRTLTEADYHA